MYQRTNTINGDDNRPVEVVQLLAKVERLLADDNPERALDAIPRARLKSPWITNATAVCLLRLGQAEQAAKLFRGLVAGPGGVTLRTDAPLVFKCNYATALLAFHNVAGCLSVLAEIGEEDNSTVQQLRAAIAAWKKSLSLWQKFRWLTGDVPQRPVALDFPLGQLE